MNVRSIMESEDGTLWFAAAEFGDARLTRSGTFESPRTQWALTKDSVIAINDTHLRLRDHDQLVSVLSALGNALSQEQTDLGIKTAMTGGEFIYPSVHAFEQEIIWSLYQMAKGSA